jgi:cell filamentation protein
MIQASIAANDRGDTAVMRRMFDEVSNPKRVAALRVTIDELDRHGFAWNDRYVATMEPGHQVEVTMAGGRGEHFMARTGTDILIGNTADLPDPRPERFDTFTFKAAEHSWEPETRFRHRDERQRRRDEPEQDIER